MIRQLHFNHWQKCPAIIPQLLHSFISDSKTYLFFKFLPPDCFGTQLLTELTSYTSDRTLIGLYFFFIFITPPLVGRRGIVFARFLSFFVCFFVSLSATLRENDWTDFYEIFREGVEWPWDDLIKFWVTSGKQVGRSKVNLLSPAIVQSQLHSLGGSRGGVCCAPHHSLLIFRFG